MDNTKLFNDIFLEAQAAQILLMDIHDGTVPIKELKIVSKKLERHIENIMAATAYRESKDG